MNLTDLSFFNLASDRMTWLAARQKVTSENVANANTPGYAARDVSSFSDMVAGSRTSGVRLATTNANHMQGRGAAAPGIAEVDDPAAARRTLDGNSVDLEQQAMRAAETSDNYRMAAQLYRKGYELLSAAIGGSN